MLEISDSILNHYIILFRHTIVRRLQQTEDAFNNIHLLIQEMSIVQEYCQFATLTSSKITLIQQGLYCLEEYDDVVVVTVEGDFFYQNFDSNHENAIWISRYPQYNHQIKRYVVLLKLSGNDDSAKTLGHQFCAYISTMILLVNYDRFKINHISIESTEFKNKTAALVGFMENSETLNLIPTDQKFRDYLDLQRVSIKGYPSCDGFEYSYIQTQQKWRFLLSSIKSILETAFGSNELLHGHIIKEYAENLAAQQSKSRKMNPVKAEEEIQIDEEFQEYLEVVGKYNGRCKNRLGNRSEPHIQQLLKEVREEIEMEKLFTNNGYYAEKLQKYMNRKESQIKKLNEQFHDSENLNFLQGESEKLLKKVKKSRGEIEKKEVDGELKKLIDKYEKNAYGRNKDKLLSDYLQLFTPTLYEEAGLNEALDSKLNKVHKQNRELEEEIKKMEKKNGKCCNLM